MIFSSYNKFDYLIPIMMSCSTWKAFTIMSWISTLALIWYIMQWWIILFNILAKHQIETWWSKVTHFVLQAMHAFTSWCWHATISSKNIAQEIIWLDNWWSVVHVRRTRKNVILHGGNWCVCGGTWSVMEGIGVYVGLYSSCTMFVALED